MREPRLPTVLAPPIMAVSVANGDGCVLGKELKRIQVKLREYFLALGFVNAEHTQQFVSPDERNAHRRLDAVKEVAIALSDLIGVQKQWLLLFCNLAHYGFVEENGALFHLLFAGSLVAGYLQLLLGIVDQHDRPFVGPQ
jgi:hypothetical protein